MGVVEPGGLSGLPKDADFESFKTHYKQQPGAEAISDVSWGQLYTQWSTDLITEAQLKEMIEQFNNPNNPQLPAPASSATVNPFNLKNFPALNTDPKAVQAELAKLQKELSMISPGLLKKLQENQKLPPEKQNPDLISLGDFLNILAQSKVMLRNILREIATKYEAEISKKETEAQKSAIEAQIAQMEAKIKAMKKGRRLNKLGRIFTTIGLAFAIVASIGLIIGGILCPPLLLLGIAIIVLCSVLITDTAKGGDLFSNKLNKSWTNTIDRFVSWLKDEEIFGEKIGEERAKVIAGVVIGCTAILLIGICLMVPFPPITFLFSTMATTALMPAIQNTFPQFLAIVLKETGIVKDEQKAQLVAQIAAAVIMGAVFLACGAVGAAATLAFTAGLGMTGSAFMVLLQLGAAATVIAQTTITSGGTLALEIEKARLILKETEIDEFLELIKEWLAMLSKGKKSAIEAIEEAMSAASEISKSIIKDVKILSEMLAGISGATTGGGGGFGV